MHIQDSEVSHLIHLLISHYLSHLSVPAVEFKTKIKDVNAVEGGDAIFQCVLSTPLNRITWSKQDSSLEDEDKYEITVSEDKLTHTLRVKDCEMTDNGAYYAIAGITSSSASLTVKGGTTFVFSILKYTFVNKISFLFDALIFG